MICNMSRSFDLCDESYKNRLLLAIYLKLNKCCTFCSYNHPQRPKQYENQ
jgi:hypothetical protein